jgi:glycerol uptake facilitator-like aquaporin
MTDVADRSSALKTAAAAKRAEHRELVRKLVAEALGTGFLVAIVIGSGIYAQRLSTDAGLQLLENSIATGAGLVALILAFGSVSGAHFNPVVTLADRVLGGLSTATPWPTSLRRSSAAASVPSPRT